MPDTGFPPPHGFVEICEAGTRDGLQIEATIIPTAEKIALVDAMLDSGIRHVEVTSFVSPRAVPQMADAEEVLRGIRKRPDTNLMALVPNLRGAERAVTTPVDGGVLLISASETHNRKNLNRSIDESLAAFPAVAARLRDGGKEVLGAVAVAFGCPFEGEVSLDGIIRIGRAYAALGVTQMTLGDTTGMAAPNNVRRTLRGLRAALPGMQFTMHLHNTRGVGLANVLVSLDEGVRRFDAAAGGLGGCPFAAGATGNICTEDLVYLLDESGWTTGVDLDQSIAVAKRMEALLGRTLPGQVMRAGPRLRLHAANAVPTAAG
ncbi:hydroxymethylglutaryl-CoA lyase [Roseomonas haemaphysalidis]|uniref:Hydroxymethylglutaryl-CoA lyase n=1 Tax=Roseomonas haemaphysalidis TaxID=2768162 RepID=A0ABS3KKL8_9PROT|nr:hydroxymethylglutaryl-CoA lyase [Roseomonas haemaphysalidis]MBO1078013.1 hydroxymethylglutaryl-CoA lyase [Roseomonas haemaphysalidis]